MPASTSMDAAARRPVARAGVARSRGRRRVCGLLATAAIGAVLWLPAPATAKTPGNTYCFLGVCHRVKSIAETHALVGKTMPMQASFYDDPHRDRFNPSNLTSSGEYFRSGRPDNAASPILPDGTKLLVWHPGTRRAVVVRVNNAGPYHGRRLLDLSRAAAERLGFAAFGVATVHVRVLEAPSPAEAGYRRGRSYPPVPGFIGVFESLETALAEAGHALGALLLAPHQPEATTIAAANPASARGKAAAGRSQRIPKAKSDTVAVASAPATASPQPAPLALERTAPATIAASIMETLEQLNEEAGKTAEAPAPAGLAGAGSVANAAEEPPPATPAAGSPRLARVAAATSLPPPRPPRARETSERTRRDSRPAAPARAEVRTPPVRRPAPSLATPTASPTAAATVKTAAVTPAPEDRRWVTRTLTLN